MSQTKTYNIKSLKFKNGYKELILTNNRSYILPKSTCIDKNNTLHYKNGKLLIDCNNGDIQIYPPYCMKEKIKIGGFSIEILIKEITDESELQSYQSLSKYHYKDKSLFGRTSILVAVNTTPYLPKVIGYIELATPFYVNKPRSEILNSTFKHNGISWETWDKETTRKYINVITRIARCVVYPEFRGIGLGQKLVEHAEKFAKERWQISNFKPLFLEISADMLKYVPFAEKAGMHYVGETEGNLDRIHKDLEYLLKNYQRVMNKEIVGNHQIGIVEQQKSRLRKAMRLAEEYGMTIEEFIARLEKLQKNKRLKDFTFFNGLVSLPKPTYIKGLDEVADQFIVEQLDSCKQDKIEFYEKIRPEPIEDTIELHNVNVSYTSNIRRTRKTQAIHNAFGISPSDINSPIIKDFSIKIEPGEIVLFIGSSGSGKTTLLNLLSRQLKDDDQANITGSFKVPNNYYPGIFKEIRSQKALVEYFGNESVEYALQLLSSVGLSDAFVFVKRFDELSNGQKYRALMAKLIHSQKNVLIIDEFCANLDPISSNVLAYRMHKLAKRLGITLIAGAAHYEAFIKSLKPDRVVRLSTAWDYEILDGSKFATNYLEINHDLKVQTLRIKPQFFDLILEGKKNTTIRLNNSFQLGFTLLESGGQTFPIYIKDIYKKRFNELSAEDAKRDGFQTLRELKKTLMEIYKGLREDSEVVILHFKALDFK